jgi:hypothetical protein
MGLYHVMTCTRSGETRTLVYIGEEATFRVLRPQGRTRL